MSMDIVCSDFLCGSAPLSRTVSDIEEEPAPLAGSQRSHTGNRGGVKEPLPGGQRERGGGFAYPGRPSCFFFIRPAYGS